MADFQADGHFAPVNYGTRSNRGQGYGHNQGHNQGQYPRGQAQPYDNGQPYGNSQPYGYGPDDEGGYDAGSYDHPPHDHGADLRDGASFGTMFTWVGGVVSLALVAGIGLWGYQMVMRDVSGVPVVRAMTGEVRRVPTDAGGQTADFLGLSVNHVAAAKEAASAPDQVTLAPNGIALGDDALTEEELAARSAIPASATMSLDGAVLDTGETDGTGQDAAAIARLRADGEGTSQGASDDRAEASGTTIRPRARPASLTALASVVQASASSADIVASAPPAETVTNIAADAVPPGTQLAQLGAFASEDVALSEWTRLSKQFDIYLAGKARVIQKAETGGRTFYRLRAMGFADLSDTRRFCAALVADKADCIPVLTK
ncbi:SPOR domain-containing protein [Pseudooceanicola sediminis]|uniref:SPOR domain-containing protein n=1 Tax=Pseudooceanicola sediminis TaxID=2211117 RepID=A0A399J5S2_9RHOB|nr:SPOR domain-containing protein [Pseudooceanicola sediminis]KAA2316822.1 SPOR domain-containing protein [Puniceibacterium sp. HSS470]RII40721.1 SPOR domain-containing protein [Pseudooceanicola sediminis]|tara:strand:- start:194263 stop:195384 length:1122 start_codon:yes stop_codon:yes gene_type:complete